MQPALLRADNLTPPTRTPWGGRKILERYKRGLAFDTADTVVGESWEISVEPDFPSRLATGDQLLADVIAADPQAWLGDEIAARYDGQTPLLVKLLDSADNLSVQVHPADGDTALAPGESGKPESWLVLDAEPGAGLYLGFRDGVDRAAVEACLAAEGALDELLNFVPVEPGDVFLIQARSAHAIGQGVTLVEPQFVAPGRRGITYRYWDWNRRYDGEGKLDPAGEPRALHLERSLEVTDWEAPRGDAFVATCRATPRMLEDGPMRRELLIDWPWFVVEQWSGQGELAIPAAGTMLGLTSVAGVARLTAGDGAITLQSGQSAVIPAAAGRVRVQSQDARIIATRSRLQSEG